MRLAKGVRCARHDGTEDLRDRETLIVCRRDRELPPLARAAADLERLQTAFARFAAAESSSGSPRAG